VAPGLPGETDLIRPFRGPQRFLENASLSAPNGVLTVSDDRGRVHRFDLTDSRAPYRLVFRRRRIAIVDRDGRAILITRSHLWDAGEILSLGLSSGLAPQGEADAPRVGRLRDDGVRMRDLQPWDLIPLVPIAPIVGVVLLVELLSRQGVIPSPLGLILGASGLVFVCVVALATIRSERGIPFHRLVLRRRQISVVHERGRVDAVLPLERAERLIVHVSANSDPFALAVIGEMAIVDGSGTELVTSGAVNIQPGELVEMGRRLGLPVELVPSEKVKQRKELTLVPYPAGGVVSVTALRGELTICGRKGETSTVPLEGETAPRRIVLLYGGLGFLPHLRARLALLDGSDRSILETPLDWWSERETGSRIIYSFAKALGVPVQVVDGRARRVRFDLAARGISYRHREVLWYVLGVVGPLVIALASSFVLAPINFYVVEVPDWAIAVFAGGPMLGSMALWWWYGITRGTFRVWRRLGDGVTRDVG